MFESLVARSRAAVRDPHPFVLLPELRFAATALERLTHPGRSVDRPGSLTVVIGPRGSGKTRIVAHALAELARKQPRAQFVVQSAGDWLHFVEQAGPSEVSYPAMIVAEDADRTLTSPDEADAFARWLDELQRQNVRVLVTLSEPPGQVPAFSPRLFSRLHAGLTVRLPALSTDSRRQLVRGLAESREVLIAEDVVDWIASQAPGTCRSVVQLVEQLTRSSRSGAVITTHALEKARLADVSNGERPPLAVIAAEVADEFGVPVGELRSESRDQALQLPRRCAMWIAHEARWPMAQIGRYFGRRTHASVSYSCRELTRQLTDVPTLRDRVQRLQLRLADRLREECG